MRAALSVRHSAASIGNHEAFQGSAAPGNEPAGKTGFLMNA